MGEYLWQIDWVRIVACCASDLAATKHDLVHLPEELAALFVELDRVQFRAAHLVCAGECDGLL